jgi:hypothetical protein
MGSSTFIYNRLGASLEGHTQQALSLKKVHKYEKVMQLKMKGDTTTEEECYG